MLAALAQFVVGTKNESMFVLDFLVHRLCYLLGNHCEAWLPSYLKGGSYKEPQVPVVFCPSFIYIKHV